MIRVPFLVRPGTLAVVLDRARQAVVDWLLSNRNVLVCLILTQVVAYGYLFSMVMLTHHTFPHTWIKPYPSFKTYSEGRWLADIVIWLQGGSGVQSFQMAGAVCLQAINAVLFARLLGLARTGDVVLAGLFFCLYPAFLDYYSFTIDHLTFCIGDTLVILGATLLRVRPGVRSSVVATLLFALSLAAYQPKLSLMLVMLVMLMILRLVEDDHRPSRARVAVLLGDLGAALVIAVGSLVLYAASLKAGLLSAGAAGNRRHVNDLPEICTQVVVAYEKIWEALTSGRHVPDHLWLLPAVAVALGLLALMRAASARGPGAILGVLLLVGAMPLALRATYLVNAMTWPGAGRITFVYGYAVLFFLAAGLRWGPIRPVFRALTAIFVYVFFVIATQESNAGAMRTIYETQFIARIAARAESLADAAGGPRPVVVVGEYPRFPHEKYVRRARVGVALREQAFQPYRQVEMLNFFLGRDAFRQPTAAEVAAALPSVDGRSPWPSAESVYAVDGVVMILLEPWREGIDVTRASER